MSKQFRENVEIISSASGQSWLKLVNLPSGTAQTTYNGLLWLDASGNVIKINAATIATVTVWPTAPSAPVSGQQWLDTSLAPSELKVYNGAAWELAGDEVQHYANFAAFPATGDEDVLYVDDAADIIYVWDSTTSAYVNASWTGAGLFTITDGTTSQSIGVGNTLSFLDTNLIKAEVSATDTLTISIDTTGATTGQVPSYNGTNVVWATPLSQNIYTDDGVLDSNRVVDMNWNFLRFQDNTVPTKYIELDVDNMPTIKFNAFSDSANVVFDEWNSEMRIDYTTWSVVTNNVSFISNSSSDIQLNATADVLIDAQSWSYSLVTSPAAAPTLTGMEVLMRESTTGILYKKGINTISSARYANTRTPTANVETVHTHALDAGEDIQIQVRDATTKEIVDVEIRIISATTFGVTSTTADPLRVIAL